MTTSRPKLRCAIYTRKSSDEGLDQAFNSLHAQREACEAYIKSQVGEGWQVHPAAYDDGGISGGTMERPALKRLLSDVDRGIVDVVVVYKVDRLTRSLMDFSRIVERFDARSVSFVSITQAFNTTNSMGRLTLNVLLSFAQFEREVTGERIRDKIAASKAKGMWMGGNLPLGYDPPTDPLTRWLVVNPAQADEVREFFARYLALGSVHTLVEELNAEGRLTRVLTAKSGTTRGGTAWSRGAMFHLLRNRVYVGEITHRGKAHPSGHAPIVDPALFQAVQDRLDGNLLKRRERAVMPDGSPLVGLIVDADGLGMTPAMAYGKLGRKYRYYVSRPLQLGTGKALDRDEVRRVAAGAIEALVSDTLKSTGIVPGDAGWKALRLVIQQVRIGRNDITVSVSKDNLGAAAVAQIRNQLPEGQKLVETGGKAARLDFVLPGRPVFRGGRTWIAAPDGAALKSKQSADPALLKALQRAHAISSEYGVSPKSDVGTNRAGRGVEDSYKRKLVPLAYLAPDIQSAITQGRLPAGLTLEHMLKITLPAAWDDQRRILGFKTGPT
ncbi:MAG: hypothetical protein DCE92_01835 [Alphaproteobacteria bacterium]|nr:MAG: hypothetical protein DCE92_01835 [Alphaproteobacteria bacterium]